MSKKFKVPLGLVGLYSDPIHGDIGDVYFNLTSSKIRVYADNQWQDVGSGGTGSTLNHTHDYNGNAIAGVGNLVSTASFGSGVPSNNDGANQDLYIDITNLNIYQKVEGSWGSPTEINTYTKSEVDTLVSNLGNSLGDYVPIGDVGQPDGVAALDSSGHVPDSQIPSTIARDSEIITSYNALTDKPDFTIYAPKASPALTGTTSVDNLTINGSLTFNGTATQINSESLSISDPIIYLGTANTGNSLDLGFAGHFNDGTYQHTGLVRDASDGKWKLFSHLIPEPGNTLDFSAVSYDTLKAGLFEGSGASLTSIPNSALVNSSITINGSSVSLGGSVDITGLPSQINNAGKYLTTDGTTASWAAVAGGGDMAMTLVMSQNYYSYV